MEIGHGRYRLIRRLGEGGTGVVYQAADLLLGRTVAVKVLHPSMTLDLLRREGQSLASLTHPNVVDVHDVVEDNGTPYLIMEYVDGCTLEWLLLERGPLPVDTALQIFRQVAGVIAEAHARGLLHCDLKPANVLVTPSGEVKLTDFTLARRQVNGAFDGPAGGSASYAAPEQLSGNEVSPRTDVYGLGCLLRRMITGSEGISPAAGQVAAAVERATALAPEDRFASVEDMLAELPLTGSGPTQLAPLSRTPQLTRVAPALGQESQPARSRRVIAALAVAALALLLSLGALYTHLTVFASPTRIAVPDLVATQSDSAQLVIRSLALRYSLVRAYSPDAPAGTIVGQRPAPGSLTVPGQTVVLVVSKGPQPIAVPDLRGLSRAASLARLRRLGFRVAVQTHDTISHPAGEVLDQSPAPGAERIPGSTVTVTVSTKPWWWIF